MPSSTSRRNFLKSLTVGGTVTALSSPVTFTEALAAASSEEESYWEVVRWQFPFSEDKVPMNAANLCPSLIPVATTVSALTRDIDVDCSFPNRAKFNGLREEARSRIASHLKVTADEVALVRNTSEANCIVNNGLDLKEGDDVVLWDQNHPTNNVAWKVRAARFSFKVRPVSTPTHPTDPVQLLHPFLEALSDRTRVLAITHVSNVSGIRLPVRELCRAAHRRGIHVHVDGAQTWGAFDVDLKDLGCDSYSASAHKWFVGPKEAGLLYVGSQSIPRIWPSVVAPGWGSGSETGLKGARKFESLGQRDDACLAGLGTAAAFHAAVGAKRIESRIVELASMLKAGAVEMGLDLVTPTAARLSGGVCIIDVPRDRRGEVVTRMYQEFGIAGAATSGLRLCPHIYNTKEHVQRALVAVREILT